MPEYDPVTKISIVPRGAAGGLTFFAPSEERLESGLYSRSYLENQMAVALGGRIAEELIFGDDDITTGASGDFQQVGERAVWRGAASMQCCVPSIVYSIMQTLISCISDQLCSPDSCPGCSSTETHTRAAMNFSCGSARHTEHFPCPAPRLQVTRIARLMVTQLGFSKKLGQVAWSQGGGQSFLGQSMAQPADFSAKTADEIDNEVRTRLFRASFIREVIGSGKHCFGRGKHLRLNRSAA